jgi:hypothetical protein
MAAMDETMRLSCPNCRAIVWSHGGATMAVDINGEIHRLSVNRLSLDSVDARWECARCGFEPVADSDLAIHLVEMKVAFVN